MERVSLLRPKRMEQARSGYVVPTHTATYGFEVVGDRTKRRYEVHEEHMAVVRRIFQMVGMEGYGNRTVAKTLNAEGVPSPPAPVKAKHPERAYGWRHQFVRRCVLNDSYRPHTPEELAALVEQGFMAPEVADGAPEGCGVWWYSGRDYEGEEHRVAVPVPPSGVSREVADRARAAVVDNVPLSGAGDRGFWELSGGILRCGGCGLHMQVHAVKSGGRVYHYLRCPLNQRATLEKCPVNARVPAERLEETVWRFVIGLLTDPWRMVEGVDRLIEEERSKLRGDPEQEMRGLRRQMRDLEVRRGRAQEAYLAGAFSVDELRARQQQLDEAKEAVLGSWTFVSTGARACASWWPTGTCLDAAPTPGTTSCRSTPTCRSTSSDTCPGRTPRCPRPEGGPGEQQARGAPRTLRGP